MKIKPTPLQDAFIIELEPVTDDRGLFTRVFCQQELRNILHDKNVVQINHSLTRQKGALRGMHFQYSLKSEIKYFSKMARRGIVCEKHEDDVYSRRLCTWISDHGRELRTFLYLHTEFYSPEHEGGVRYNDPKIGIKWPLEVTDISERDKNHPLLGEDFLVIEF